MTKLVMTKLTGDDRSRGCVCAARDLRPITHLTTIPVGTRKIRFKTESFIGNRSRDPIDFFIAVSQRKDR